MRYSEPERLIMELLKYLGENPNREGLRDSPKRIARALKEWTDGYGVDPKTLFKTFRDGAERYDEMVMVKDIPFYSHCEHHLAPFFGTVTIGYIPFGKILGLSKFNRLVRVFSRRLQVQERMTNQIADSIQDNMTPIGIGVLVRARHLCMESRGVEQQGHHTVTNALRGVMRSKPEARAEFLQLAGVPR